MIKKIALTILAGIILSFSTEVMVQTWKQGFIQSNHLDTVNITIGEVGKLVFADTSIPKLDTAKVLMLVCDTSGLPNKVFEWGTKKSFNTWNTYSMFGYEVTLTEFIPDHFEGYTFYQGGNETKHIRWLDENKKPFPKNTIIWLTQKTNQ